MGKGDIRTRRGKIWRGTTGVTRPRKRKNVGLRPAAPVRKVKALKDLPEVVDQPAAVKPVVEAVKPQAAEAVKPQAAEAVAPVIEKVQPAAENVAVETTPVVETPVHTETKAVGKKEKTSAKKASKPAVKKTPAAKKPAAKEIGAKKAAVKKKK